MTEGLQTEKRSRVLVLDDDASQLDTLSALLEDEGFDVLVSETAAAGIERLGRGDVDVAIVDLHLPDADEVQLLDSLAELADDVASIIHTGYSSYRTAKKAVNIGAFAYVEKGSDPSELLRQVHRAVQVRLVQRAKVLENAVVQRTRELQESEARYYGVVEDMPVLVCCFLPSGEISFVNKAYCDYFAKSFGELVGSDFRLLIPDADRETVMADISALSIESPTQSHEHRVIAPDGETRWQRWTNRALFDARGNVVGYQSIGEDITERRCMEDNLRRSEELFRTLAESAPIGIYLADANGDCTYVNAQWSKVAGLTLDEARGDKWAMALHPEDREAIRSGWYRMTRSQGSWEGEYRFQNKHGEVSWVYGTAAPLTDDRGEIAGYVGANVDISERKRAQEELQASEERYRQIVETANEGIWVIDAEANTQFVNPRMAEMLGYSVEEMLGKPLLSFMDDEMKAEARQKLKRRERGIAEQHEHRFRRKDGTDLWAIVSTNPVFDDQGRYAGGLGMIADLTERRQLEEQLRHTQKMEAVGQLAAGVAHEFNNLLFGILGSAELILATKEGELGEHLERPLRDIKKCGRRGATLTKQLLSFARKKKSEVSHFDVNQMVSGLESVLQQILTETVTFEKDLAAELPPIEADKGEIEQALLNLASNARDAMPDGGKLTIRTATVQLDEARASTYPHARPGPCVQLSVADDGCGMGPETVERIFEPFFTTKPVGQGTGLGLSTVFADVTKNGGIIEVESQQGEGTIFHIYLPSAQQTAEKGSDDAERSADAFPSGSETILVVDDDEVVLDSGGYVLEMRGYNVIRALGALEALEAAADHDGPIDLLLTDVTMPEVNGWELSQKLIAQRPNMKVVFMSGYAQDVLDAGAAEGEHIEFIEKPPEGDALFRRIRDVLDAPGGSIP